MTPGDRRTLHEAQRTILQFWDWASLCYCGDPGALLTTIAEGLEAHPIPGEHTEESWDRTQQWLAANLWGGYMLSAWQLTDHGSSLRGGWLTEDGIRLREAIRTAGTDVIRNIDDWFDADSELYPDGPPESPGDDVGRWELLPVQDGLFRAASALSEAMDQTPTSPRVRDRLAELRKALEAAR